MSLLDQYYADKCEPEPDGLKDLIAVGQPLLSWEDANQRVIELTCENIRLQAELDKIKLMMQLMREDER